MGPSVAEMSADELRELIESSIERKFIELFGDPDEGLEVKEEFRQQLLQQEQDFEQGHRGKSFDKVVELLQTTDDHV